MLRKCHINMWISPVALPDFKIVETISNMADLLVSRMFLSQPRFGIKWLLLLWLWLLVTGAWLRERGR